MPWRLVFRSLIFGFVSFKVLSGMGDDFWSALLWSTSAAMASPIVAAALGEAREELRIRRLLRDLSRLSPPLPPVEDEPPDLYL